MTKSIGLKICCVTVAVLASWISISHAAPLVKINAGYSLYDTQNGTTLSGQQFIGVPLGTYNFGGSIGVQNVGQADTIIQRLSDASATNVPPATAPAVSIVVDALQLETPVPTAAFGPLDFYFLTLQSVRGGPASTGQLTATFNTGTNGTFSSFFDVFFDIREGSLNGPIVASSDSVVSANSIPWLRTPDSANDVIINGVNHNLNGLSNGGDFWPTQNYTESGGAFNDVLGNALVPEPGTLSLAALGLSGLLCLRKRRSS